MTDTQGKEAIRLKEQVTSINTKKGPKAFVPKDNALLMFHRDYPGTRGQIKCEMLSIEPPIFKAEIWGDGIMLSCAHANPDGNTTTFRQVEGAAINRALAIAGYNAKSVLARYAELMDIEEAKKLLGSGGERRMGSEPTAPKVQTAEPPPQVAVDEHGEPIIVTTTPPAEPKSNGHVASAAPTDEPKNMQTLGGAIKAAVQPKLMETATPGAHKQMPVAKRGHNPFSKVEGSEK